MNLYTQRRSRARLRSRQRGGGWGLLLPALLASVVDELVVFEKEPGKRQRLGAGGAAATTTTLRPSFFFGAAAVTSSTAPYVCILPARRGEQRIHNYFCTRLTLSSLANEQFSDAAVPCTGREALWSLRIQRSARFCAIPWQNSRVSPCGLAACKTQATRCKPRRTTDLGETCTQCFNLHRHPQTTTKQPPAARPRRRPAGAPA